MKKRYLYLAFTLLVVLPFNVYGMTEDEALELMSELPITESGGSCQFKSNSIPYDVMKENTCSFTYEEYVSRHPYKDTYTDTALRNDYNEDIIYCTNNLANHMFNIYDDVSLVYDETDDKLNISINYVKEDSTTGILNKKCSVQYEEYDEDVIDIAKEVDQKLDYTYTLYGYDAINSFYHYGGISADVWKENTIMYRFPKIKEILMDYPEFGYVSSAGGGVGSFYGNSVGFIKMYKNDILYGMHYFDTNYFAMLLVDEDEAGTSLDKAKKALNKHFKNKVEFSFDEDNIYGIDDSGFDLANKAFGTTGITYDGIDVMMELNGERYNIGVVEMDKDAIKEFEVKAKDKNTGVSVYTNSFDVPVDATLEVEDRTDDVKNIFNDKNYKVLNAFNIDVLKTGNGDLVDNVEDGIYVYIPIDDNLDKNIKVCHITDEDEKGEEFTGEVVEVDGKNYVKFMTYHFSTYAVVSDSSIINNPNTGDNIYLSIGLFIISLVIVVLFRKKIEL